MNQNPSNIIRVHEDDLKYQIDWQNEIKTAFQNGELFNGISFVNYPSGKLKFETPYLNGKKHGVEKSWFESGKLKAESECINGIGEGRANGWHENGRLAYDWFWKNRKPYGTWKTFYDDGRIKKEKIFVDGNPISDKNY